ncbi:defense against restriction DarA-related protein [Undibacterium crateris]|uniref:defense against restriction DarA-related protein n=1 Tax=Undibacterium crateris TaxID=2528175 RepID=UPI00138A340A|nr:hypothetical protein [Undibacterium crateris]NDI85057.1 hypothetical protein [Undibacterium crateris]
MGKVLLNFSEMGSAKDASTKAIRKAFLRAGAEVAQADILPGLKRTSGITYRELQLIFSDSQTVTLMVKQSGDIFQVKLNGKIIPIKNQDDHQEAATELAAKMESGRTSFQKRLASIKVALPAAIKTSVVKIEESLQTRLGALNDAIAEVNEQIAAIDSKLNVG